jgi:hypothetical protein
MIGTRPTDARAGHCWGPVLVLLGALGLVVSLAACAPGALGRAGADGPRLSFQERSHDFGRISYSQPTEYRFAFTNTGSEPLEIGDIRPEPANPGG